MKTNLKIDKDRVIDGVVHFVLLLFWMDDVPFMFSSSVQENINDIWGNSAKGHIHMYPPIPSIQ